MKIERGDEETAARKFVRLRDVKLCLDLECSAVWADAELVCPACGGREAALIETFVNRQEKVPVKVRGVLPFRRVARR